MTSSTNNTDFSKIGDHWFICDVCGQKTWFSDSRRTWDGFLCCVSRGCWYPKHPQDNPLPVINDPFTLPAETQRPSPNWDNLPYLPPTGISSWTQILPPYDQYTWSQNFLEWGEFDDGVSWFTNDQSGP